MRYFVTGATGFIGGRLARRLRNDGHDVVALVRTPSKASPLRDAGVEIAEGDITDRESMRAPMAGADGVFHVAAWYEIGARDHRMAERINVDGTRNVLEMMKELGIRKGVYTSTLAVFSNTHGKIVDESYRFVGKHNTEYDRTKAAAHYDVAVPMMEAGLPLVIVQPGLVYGPGDTSAVDRTLRQYLQGKMPMVPKGVALCWAHVDDIVEAHVLAMEKGGVGESYITCGPPHTLVEALQTAEEITGIKAPRMQAAPGMMRAMAAVMGVIGAVVPLPPDYHPETLRVMAGATYLGNPAKAREAWGWTARPLEEGLRETLAVLMNELGITPKKAA